METIERIVKRDGRVVDFDIDKITDAIFKAAQVLGGKDKAMSAYLAKQVELYLLEVCHNDTPTVEQIQDAVEKILIENGHARTAKEYILYTRRGHQGFDNGILVKSTSHTIELNPDEVYSFKVTALNDGGESFPSEVLSCGISSKNKGTVLIVNAFTRLEGPQVINTATTCGFDLNADPGVPYGAYTGFCGYQRSFDRSKAGSEASDGLGMSGDELEGKIMMGNTFDYPVIHGRAILLSGNHSFTSCSEKALTKGKVTLSSYPIIDLIYGTQRQFDSRMNSLIEQFYNQGGKVLMSAANAGCPSIGGNTVATLPNKSFKTLSGCGLTFDIYRDMNPQSYSVPSPSVLAPSGQAIAILTYSNGNCAGIAQQQRFVRPSRFPPRIHYRTEKTQCTHEGLSGILRIIGDTNLQKTCLSFPLPKKKSIASAGIILMSSSFQPMLTLTTLPLQRRSSVAFLRRKD